MKTLNRRTLLRALGLLSAGAVATPVTFFDALGRSNRAYAAASGQKYLIIVRTLFDFRREERTNFGQELSPLTPWQSELSLVQGLSANGDGSEYHNGKQIRFATSCTPTNRTNQTTGGGAYDGKSVDIVTGEYLQGLSGCRNPYLILGARPYSVAGLHATFETISFANKNQYVRPEYDLANVRTQIDSYATYCGEQQEEVNTNLLEKQNRVLEKVMLDLQRSREFKTDEIKGQAENLERQFDALRDENLQRINGAPDCVTARSQPLTHSYNRHAIMTQGYDTTVRTMNYTAALSLKTNFTNVVTLNYNFSGHGQPNVPGFHEMTHPGGFSRPPTSQELDNLEGLSAFQVQMFAHLLRELDDFGILDETMVIYSPHERPTHDHRDVPLIAYGAPRTGTYASNRRVQDVCKDILDCFGVPNASNFGGETSAGGVIS